MRFMTEYFYKIRKVVSCWVLFSLLLFSYAPGAEAFFDFFNSPSEVPVLSGENFKDQTRAPSSKGGFTRTPLVALLIEEELLEHQELAEKINRYAEDIQQDLRAEVIEIPVPYRASVHDIYEGLAHLYFSGKDMDGKSQLEGVVLIGDVPIPVVEKSKNMWPTIFPYVDFVKPTYLWSKEKDRFFYEGGDQSPEIWHGVIRSRTDGKTTQHKELIDFFDLNHRVRKGEESYSKKVFYADFHRQKEVLPDTMLKHYKRWIRYGEEIQYLRFTKHFLKKLYDELESEGIGGGGGNLDVIPDIQTKAIAEPLLKRYQEAHEGWLSQLNGRIKAAGRWEGDEVDTLISLITRKDESSFLLLKAVNDAVETALVEEFERMGLASDIPIKYEQEVVLPPRSPEAGPEIVIKPLYWNGVLRSNMKVEDCTIWRGSPREGDFAFSQLAELNRTLNQKTVSSCEDEYEGCCAQNMKVREGIPSYTKCDLTSHWYVEGARTIVHQGAERPVYDLVGTREEPGPVGAFGCDPLIREALSQGDYIRYIPSFFVHDEPKAPTIKAQVDYGFSQALPVDDPRSFSFYDSGYNFHKIAFPNFFDFRDQNGITYSSSTLKSQILSEIDHFVAKVNRVVANSRNIPADQMDQLSGLVLRKQVILSVIESVGWPKILEALIWIDQDVDEKNRRSFEGAISDKESFRSAFYYPEQEGYEVLELIGTGDRQKGINMGFQPDSTTDSDDEFLEVLREISQIPSPKVQDRRFLGTDVNADFFGAEVSGDVSDKTKEILSLADQEELSVVEREAYIQQQREQIENRSTPASAEGTNFVQMKGGSTQVVTASKEDQKPEGLGVLPRQVRVSSREVSPIHFQIGLLDSQGRVLADVYEGDLQIKFDSKVAAEFFTIKPNQNLSVSAGRAQFSLIPKTLDKGGKFHLWVEGEGLSSKKVPVIVSPLQLKVASEFPVEVKAEEGVVLRAKILDFQNKLSLDMDGEEVVFETQWGHFQGGNTAVIDGGIAKILFLPGKKAGLAKIKVSDVSKSLPLVTYELELDPAPPAQIRLEGATNFWVKGGDWQNLGVQVFDRYDNKLIMARQNLSWDLSVFDVQDKSLIDEDSSTKEVEYFIRNGKSELALRADKDLRSDKATIVVESQINDRRFKDELDLLLVKDPTFDVDLSHSDLVAGDDDFLVLEVTAKTQKGAVLVSDFDVQFDSFLHDVVDLPDTLKLKNGRARLEFYAGTKAGKGQFKISSKGFETGTADFEVLPDEPLKINLSSESDFIDIADDDWHLLDVEVVDQFDNRVKSFPSSIVLHQTVASEDKLMIDEPTLTLRSGHAVARLKGKSLTGKSHLIARAPGVVSGAKALELGYFWGYERFQDFVPKSLFAMVLGFGAGDVRGNNFASSLLFSGKTQSVATLIADPDPKRRLFSLRPNGEVQGSVILKKLESRFFDVEIQDMDRKKLGLLRLFPTIESKEVVTSEIFRQQNHLYVEVSKQAQNLWRFEGNELLYQDQLALSFGDEGRVVIEDQRFLLRGTKHLFEWEIVLQGEKLATLILPFSDPDLKVVDFLQPDESGVLLRPESTMTTGEAFFVGNSTHEKMGVGLISKLLNEPSNKKLGGSQTSIEEALKSEDVGWSTPWRPAVHLASGNVVGEASKYGASDILLLLGDPTLRLLPDESQSEMGFGKELGKLVWKNNGASIDQILAGDVNGDEVDDLLVLIGDRLSVLYQDGIPEDLLDRKAINIQRDTFQPLHNFGYRSDILRFSDGVKSLQGEDIDDDGDVDLIQINERGELIRHLNDKGRFVRQSSLPDPQIPLKDQEQNLINTPLASSVADMKIARLNEDRLPDLVFVDHSNNLFVAHGTDKGYAPPLLVDNFSPVFESTDESFVPYDREVIQLMKDQVDEVVDEWPFLGATYVSFADLESDSESSDESDMTYMEVNDEGSRKWFMSILDNERFESKYKRMLLKDSQKVEVGDLIEVQFSFKANGNLTDFSFVAPSEPNSVYVPGSLSCEGCEGEIEVKTGGGVEGAFLTSEFNVKGFKWYKFKWKLWVTQVGTIYFEVGDFENGKDDLDDIMVPWDTVDGDKKLIHFYSSERTNGQSLWDLPTMDTEENDSVAVSYLDLLRGSNLQASLLDSAKESLNRKVSGMVNSQVQSLTSGLPGPLSSINPLDIKGSLPSIDLSQMQSALPSSLSGAFPTVDMASMTGQIGGSLSKMGGAIDSLNPAGMMNQLNPANMLGNLPGVDSLVPDVGKMMGGMNPAGLMGNLPSVNSLVPGGLSSVGGMMNNLNPASMMSNLPSVGSLVPSGLPDVGGMVKGLSPAGMMNGLPSVGSLGGKLPGIGSLPSLPGGMPSMGAISSSLPGGISMPGGALAGGIGTASVSSVPGMGSVSMPAGPTSLQTLNAGGMDVDADGIPGSHDLHPETASIDSSAALQNGTLESEIGASAGETGKALSSFVCGGGTCHGIPTSVSSTFPGLVTNYVPPYASPAGSVPGKPVFEIPEMIRIYSEHIGGVNKSAKSVCLGSKSEHMNSPQWNPNCTTTFDSAKEIGACPRPAPAAPQAAAASSASASGASGSVSAVSGKAVDNGVFTAQAKAENNDQITGADYVMTWLQDQMREFGYNLTNQTLSIKMPNYERNSSPQKEANDYSLSGGDMEPVLAALGNIPFVDVALEDVPVPHPNFSEEDYNRVKKDAEDWIKLQRKTLAAHIDQAQVGRLLGEVGALKGQIKDKSKKSEFTRLHKDLMNYQKFVQDMETLIGSIEDNVAVLSSYKDGVGNLMNIREQVYESMSNVVGATEVLSDYLDEFNKSIEDKVTKWKEARKSYMDLVRVWQKIPQMFYDFDKSCRSCTVDRGTLLPWLLKEFTGGAALNVQRLPNLTDETMDYSDVGGMISLKMPNPILNPVDLTLIELPEITIPNANGALSASYSAYIGAEDSTIPAATKLPALPTLNPVPQLPPLPEVNISTPDLSSLPLPTLPMPPDPPAPPLPNILGAITSMVEVPKSKFGIMCDLRLGVARTPEWYVKPYVETLTNREALLELDFTAGSRSVPKSVLDNPEKWKDKAMGYLKNNSDLLNDTKGAASTVRQSTNNVGQQRRGGEQVPSVAPSASGIQASINEYRSWFNKLSESLVDRSGFSSADKLLNDLQMEAIEAQPRSVALSEIKSDLLSLASVSTDSNVFSDEWRQTMNEKIAGLKQVKRNLALENEVLASFDDLSVFDFFSHDLVRDVLTDDKFFAARYSSENGVSPFAEVYGNMRLLAQVTPPSLASSASSSNASESGGVEVVANGIYFTDKETNLVESIVDYPIRGKVVPLLHDIDGDRVEEVIFTLGDELYIKERFAKLIKPVGVVKSTKWSFEKFAALFVPVSKSSVSTFSDFSTLNYFPTDSEVDYFEWVVGEHPDLWGDLLSSPLERKSRSWKRQARLLEIEGDIGEVVKPLVRVLKSRGEVNVTSKKIEYLPEFSLSQCQDYNVSKPLYMMKKHLIAQEDTDLFMKEVNGLDWFKKNKAKSLFLKAGESVFVEKKEVCVVKGSVFVAEEEMVTRPLEKGDLLSVDFELELGDESEVQLELYTGKKVYIFGSEKYELKLYSPSDKILNNRLELERANFYGALLGWKSDNIGTIKPFYIHDPQIADDKTPPQIKLSRGNLVTMPIAQSIEIDASQTKDELPLMRVWWDFQSEFDSNGDGDYTNDADFPLSNQSFIPRQLLKVKLPARSEMVDYDVFLHVEDWAGNVATQKISVEVDIPHIELQNATAGDGRVVGKIKSGAEDVLVFWERERAGVELDNFTVPSVSGKYGVLTKELSHGSQSVTLVSREGDKILSVLPTGRVEIFHSGWDVRVRSSNERSGVAVVALDERNHPVLVVSFFAEGKDEVEILHGYLRGKYGSVKVFDRNVEDGYVFMPFPLETVGNGGVALVNKKAGRTEAVIDKYGRFEVIGASDLSLRIMKDNEDKPVVFEILNNDQVVIGELLIPVQSAFRFQESN